MIGYPLDSHVEFDSTGVPHYDRGISSDPLRSLINKLFSDGVLPNPSTNMQVVAGSGMNVTVMPGFAICKGCLKLQELDETVEIPASNTNYGRIDSVVLKLDLNDDVRSLELAVHSGTPAATPTAPTLTRTASVYEIGLANVLIPANSSVISNVNITDTRLDTNRCGIISSISKFDTETIYQQIQADMAGFKEEEQQEFIYWFDNIKATLSGDVAGQLQLQINDNKTNIEELQEQQEKNLVVETSDEWDENTRYIGENDTETGKRYCIDGNAAYVCKVTHRNTRPSEDDGTYWRRLLLSELQGDITALKNTLGDISSASSVSGNDVFSKINNLYTFFYNKNSSLFSNIYYSSRGETEIPLKNLSTSRYTLVIFDSNYSVVLTLNSSGILASNVIFGDGNVVFSNNKLIVTGTQWYTNFLVLTIGDILSR